jgi:predicted hydrocarbon binding protein
MIFKANSPNAEVSGKNIRSYLSGMGAFEMIGRSIMGKYGIDEDPAADKWYSHQQFLDAIKEVSSRTGMHTMHMIGMRIAENVALPQEINDIEKAIKNVGPAYRQVHRNDSVSDKVVTKLDERKFQVVINTPYPCEFDTGYLRGMCKRFLKETPLQIAHDETKPCRKDGADSCTYIITW